MCVFFVCVRARAGPAVVGLQLTGLDSQSHTNSESLKSHGVLSQTHTDVQTQCGGCDSPELCVDTDLDLDKSLWCGKPLAPAAFFGCFQTIENSFIGVSDQTPEGSDSRWLLHACAAVQVFETPQSQLHALE